MKQNGAGSSPARVLAVAVSPRLSFSPYMRASLSLYEFGALLLGVCLCFHLVYIFGLVRLLSSFIVAGSRLTTYTPDYSISINLVVSIASRI